MNTSTFYLHIFTDGLDKLLSSSIWLPVWGGNDAFVFYQRNKLKGYIQAEEYERLGRIGKNQLTDTVFVDKMLSTANVYMQTYLALNKTDLDEHIALLKKSYALYFQTEEYATHFLSEEKDGEIIQRVGKFRLDFIELCIQLTKDINRLVEDISPEAPFMLVDEIMHGKTMDVTNRTNAFLLQKSHNQLKLLVGTEAELEFERLAPSSKSSSKIIQGKRASSGIARGPVFILSLAEDNLPNMIKRMPIGSVLVTESTQPDLVLACKKAVAIVTDEGGVLSHAAIISRELGIPCVVGCRNATEILQTGMEVLVNGDDGTVIL